jgi:hypothetical protein
MAGNHAACVEALQKVRRFFAELTKLGWFDRIASDVHPDEINGVCDAVEKALDLRNKFYVIEVFGGVEAEVIGPFDSDEARDEEARRVRAQGGDDEYSAFWLDVDEAGRPSVGSYSGGFFAEDGSK